MREAEHVHVGVGEPGARLVRVGRARRLLVPDGPSVRCPWRTASPPRPGRTSRRPIPGPCTGRGAERGGLERLLVGVEEVPAAGAAVCLPAEDLAPVPAAERPFRMLVEVDSLVGGIVWRPVELDVAVGLRVDRVDGRYRVGVALPPLVVVTTMEAVRAPRGLPRRAAGWLRRSRRSGCSRRRRSWQPDSSPSTTQRRRFPRQVRRRRESAPGPTEPAPLIGREEPSRQLPGALSRIRLFT